MAKTLGLRKSLDLGCRSCLNFQFQAALAVAASGSSSGSKRYCSRCHSDYFRNIFTDRSIKPDLIAAAEDVSLRLALPQT